MVKSVFVDTSYFLALNRSSHSGVSWSRGEPNFTAVAYGLSVRADAEI